MKTSNAQSPLFVKTYDYLLWLLPLTLKFPAGRGSLDPDLPSPQVSIREMQSNHKVSKDTKKKSLVSLSLGVKYLGGRREIASAKIASQRRWSVRSRGCHSGIRGSIRGWFSPSPQGFHVLMQDFSPPSLRATG